MGNESNFDGNFHSVVVEHAVQIQTHRNKLLDYFMYFCTMFGFEMLFVIVPTFVWQGSQVINIFLLTSIEISRDGTQYIFPSKF